VHDEPPRLGLVRELGARLGQALIRLDRLILHIDVGTRSLADVKRSIQAYWSTFNDRPEQWSSGLLDWERRLLDRSVRPGDRLLLIGCGSGRELGALIARECAVVGVEPSIKTLTIARREMAATAVTGAPVELFHGFAEDLDLPGDFDVCWFSYFSYSYIPDRRRRVALLARLAGELRPGGRIVVTCHCQAQPSRSRAVALGRLAGRVWRTDWEMADGDEIVRAQPAFRVFHYQHVFTPAELAAESAAAGLAISESYFPEAVVLQPDTSTLASAAH
jgi:SAM-dependent methyltransferase